MFSTSDIFVIAREDVSQTTFTCLATYRRRQWSVNRMLILQRDGIISHQPLEMQKSAKGLSRKCIMMVIRIDCFTGFNFVTITCTVLCRDVCYIVLTLLAKFQSARLSQAAYSLWSPSKGGIGNQQSYQRRRKWVKAVGARNDPEAWSYIYTLER